MNRWIRQIAVVPIELLGSVSQMFESSLRSLTTRHAFDTEAPKRSVWMMILLLPIMIPYWLLWSAYTVLAFPLSIARLSPERRYHLLWGLPSILCMVAVTTSVVYTIIRQDSVKRKYQARMDSAIDAKDFKLASVLAERIIQEAPEKDPRMRLTYAMVLLESGNSEKANSIINDLAPDDKIGYAGAHKLKASRLAAQLRGATDENLLQLFGWHLTNAGSEVTEEMETQRAFYYSLVGQNEKMIQHMESASKINPVHLIALSDLYKTTGNDAAYDRTLATAEQIFDRRLRDDPFQKKLRLQLALIKSKLRKYDEAEEVVAVGVKMHGSDEDILRAAADFSLMRYDVLRSERRAFDQQFEYLQKAMSLDPNYMPIYDRLNFLYASSPDKTAFEGLKKTLNDLIIDGKSPAVAHFALSSLLLMDGKTEDAGWHLRQSFKLDMNMPIVCNNLAWTIASGSSGQLDEALVLVNQALKAYPNRPEFRDTLGLILMKQEKYEEAIAEFESVLATIEPKKPVHENLAICYEKMGRKSIAQSHYERAKQLP